MVCLFREVVKKLLYLGSNYLKEQGQVKTTYFERFATRINVDSEVNDYIKSGLNVSYSTSKQNAPNQSEQVFPIPFNGYILFQVIILFTEERPMGHFIKILQV